MAQFYNNKLSILLIVVIFLIIFFSNFFFYKKLETNIDQYQRVTFSCIKGDIISKNKIQDLYDLCEYILDKLFSKFDDKNLETEKIKYLIAKKPSLLIEYEKGFMKSGKAYFNFYYNKSIEVNNLIENIKKKITYMGFSFNDYSNTIYISEKVMNDYEFYEKELKLAFPYNIIFQYEF